MSQAAEHGVDWSGVRVDMGELQEGLHSGSGQWSLHC